MDNGTENKRTLLNKYNNKVGTAKAGYALLGDANNESIRISFDNLGRPEDPTFVIAKRNGEKIGSIRAKEIDLRDVLQDASEANFKVYKYIDGEKEPYWDDIRSLRLAWWKEQNVWYDTTVEIDEAYETSKTVYCTQLGKSELSNINLYDVEINTESDIEREDYEPSVLYNEENPKASILNRILEKAPHYSIKHVDSSIANIQRTFTFSDKSIWDSLAEIGEEIGCIFRFSPVAESDVDGLLRRELSVYDLQQYCPDCGYRGDFEGACPVCGSTNVIDGYGEDTTIFVTADELAQEINLSEDVDSIKNCYKLVAGDDLMTATIRNCNPNGSDYIWYIPEILSEDMSVELRHLLDNYQDDYNSYAITGEYEITPSVLLDYNTTVEKYAEYDNSYETVVNPIIGYSNLGKSFYDTTDFSIFLKSALMPTVHMQDTDANEQLSKLIQDVTYVSVANTRAMSVETVTNSYLSMARASIDTRYTVTASETRLDKENLWYYLTVTVTNKSDEEDTAQSIEKALPVNDDYEDYVEQKIYKMINQTTINNVSVSGLFNLPINEFKTELKKYCLDGLSSYENVAQSIIDLLIEQGVVNGESWAPGNSIYDDLYVPYRNKLQAIQEEMVVRSEDIRKVNEMQSEVIQKMNLIRSTLNLEDYLNECWNEFCLYRREDKYSNSNYVSDGLTNRELFENAEQFISIANNEIRRASESRFSISTTLNNLLAIEKFKPIVDSFQVGNWIRIQIDNRVFKLRLTEYTINFDDIGTINVDFADTSRVNTTSDSISALNRAIKTANSLNTSVQTNSDLTEELTNIINNVVATASTANDNASEAYSRAKDVEDRANSGEFDGADGADGESAFTVIIDSSAGNIFKNQGINTTLTAHAYYGTTEVTDNVSKWTWEKHKEDGTIDSTWSRLSTNEITISATDVQNRAVFYVYAEYNPEG